MLNLIGGLLGGLGGMFGEEQTTHTVTDAEGQDLPDAQLKMLMDLFNSIVGNGTFGQANAALSGQLGRVENEALRVPFQAEAFAEDITKQASAAAGLDLESAVNNIISSNGGGGESGNSMTALLGNKVRNQTAANLGGIAAQARATGEGIRQSQFKSNTDNIRGLSGDLTSQILGLIQMSRGAYKKAHSETTATTEGGGGIGGFLGGFANALGSFSK